MKPTNPSNQCPACHFQRVVNVCGAGKRRINQTDSGEFYKAIDCTLYEDRKIVEDSGVKVCPTCGQQIQEPEFYTESAPISQLAWDNLKPTTLVPAPLGESSGTVTLNASQIGDISDVLDTLEEQVGNPQDTATGLFMLLDTAQAQINRGLNNMVDNIALTVQPIVSSTHKRRAKDLVKARYRKSRFVSKDTGGDK